MQRTSFLGDIARRDKEVAAEVLARPGRLHPVTPNLDPKAVSRRWRGDDARGGGPRDCARRDCGRWSAGRRLRFGPADPHPSWLHDQQVPRDITFGEPGNPPRQDSRLTVSGCVLREASNDESGMCAEWETEQTREPLVGGDENVAVSDRIAKNGVVGGVSKPDISDVNHFATELPQGFGRGTGEVGVQPVADHRLATMRSSVATSCAASRIAARTSSRVTPYSLVISTSSEPAASSSSRTDTGTRVPFITGCPNRTLGSTTIRRAISRGRGVDFFMNTSAV